MGEYVQWICTLVGCGYISYLFVKFIEKIDGV